jgi:hypothetical protein
MSIEQSSRSWQQKQIPVIINAKGGRSRTSFQNVRHAEASSCTEAVSGYPQFDLALTRHCAMLAPSLQFPFPGLFV